MFWEDTLNGGATVDTSYDVAINPDTATPDIISAGAEKTTAAVNDGWGDWFKSAGTALVGYAIAKDAAASGIKPAPNVPGGYAPAPAPAAPAGGLNLGGFKIDAKTLMLIAGAFVVIKVVSK